ncbi:MAG: hypothetical protein AB7Q81_25160 [Gammaproteobacteria bacterium]
MILRVRPRQPAALALLLAVLIALSHRVILLASALALPTLV